MILYIARRLLSAIVLALVVIFITFLLLSPSFDSIVRGVLGPAANPESEAALTEKLGFDRPVIVQFFDWLTKALQGDFGRSLYTSEPVVPAVMQRLSVTLSIVLVALLVTVILSFSLGVIAATRGGIVDRVLQWVSVAGFLVPGLLIAVGLVVIFSLTLKLLPATGFTPLTEDPARWLASITLPVIALVIGAVANMGAQVRGAMIDELEKDYVRTLRTRGLSANSIVLKHALRNAAGPALTILGFEFLGMLGGAFVIENVFALPGFGTYAFTAATRGDLTILLGITVFGVFLTVGVNVIIDIVNGILTPKARLY